MGADTQFLAPPKLSDAAFKYVVTFGTSELFSGSWTADPNDALATILTNIFNHHYDDVARECGGAGSFRSSAYVQFVNRQASMKISASKDGLRAILVQLQDQLRVLIKSGYNCFRFHLEEQGFAHVNYRLRCQRFFAYHNPKKLVMVDKMLADARGFEDQLLVAMTKKYGAEPPVMVDLRFRERLTAFYTYYNPGRVAEVDSILLQYSGMEEQLFGALVAKYGPEPIIAGSDAGSEESFAYTTNDEDGEERDRYPLTVPMMPFIAPIATEDLPPDAAFADFTKDVHFWDNFVNQMPGDGDGGPGHTVGIDCNQELLQQYMRSYPYLFPHILTVCCPHKEHVFRASDEFVQQLRYAAESSQAEVEAADQAHIVRAVTPDLPEPMYITRRTWEELVASWHEDHSLERRVNVGSVALEDGPEVNPPLPQLPQRGRKLTDTCVGPDTPKTCPVMVPQGPCFDDDDEADDGDLPGPAPPVPIPSGLFNQSAPQMASQAVGPGSASPNELTLAVPNAGANRSLHAFNQSMLVPQTLGVPNAGANRSLQAFNQSMAVPQTLAVPRSLHAFNQSMAMPNAGANRSLHAFNQSMAMPNAGANRSLQAFDQSIHIPLPNEPTDVENIPSFQAKQPIQTQTRPWAPPSRNAPKTGPSPAKPRQGTLGMEGMPTAHVRASSPEGEYPTSQQRGGYADADSTRLNAAPVPRRNAAGPNPAAGRTPRSTPGGRLQGRAGEKDHGYWQDLLRHQLSQRR